MDTFEYDVLLKFLLVGDTQVGKSSLLLQYSDGVFSQNTISTIGLDLKLKTQNVEGKDVRVQIIYFIISSNKTEWFCGLKRVLLEGECLLVNGF
jgi:GTPase SAR1 family protein